MRNLVAYEFVAKIDKDEPLEARVVDNGGKGGISQVRTLAEALESYGFSIDSLGLSEIEQAQAREVLTGYSQPELFPDGKALQIHPDDPGAVVRIFAMVQRAADKTYVHLPGSYALTISGSREDGFFFSIQVWGNLDRIREAAAQ